MLIWILALLALALFFTGRELAQVLRQIPDRNEDFDALSTPTQA